MKHSKTLLPILVVMLVGVMMSCSKREDVVLADFKDEKITIWDFEDAYANVSVQFLPKSSGEEGMKEFLNTMLNKEVMAYKADELGYDKDEAVVQGMQAYERMGLQTGYLKTRVSDKVEVTEEQLREHYRNKGATLSVKQLLVDTPDEAEEVYQLLMDGGDFETICKEYSKGPDAEEGGKVLTVAYGSYGPKLQRQMFAQEVGGVTRPVETPYGFFIIKVLKRNDARQKAPFEDIHDELEKELWAINEMELTNEVTDEIREDYGVTWFWENLRIGFNTLPQDRSLTNPPDRRAEVYPLLYFDQDDLDKPIVSYNNKTITVSDFSDYYDQASFFTRPRREFRLGGIKNFLTERIMAEIVVIEMERSNIREHPDIKRAINAKREELMINRLYEDMVNQQTVVTDQMIQNYYRDNSQFFEVPEKRRFGVILTGDLESAQAAYNEIKGGKRFRTVAMTYSVDEVTRETLAETDLMSEGEQPEIDRVGFELKRVGAVSEPFETSRGWMILKLTEKTEAGTFTLEEARDQVRRALKQIENETRLNELLEKWKDELGVRIYENNFKKVRIPERSVADQRTG